MNLDWALHYAGRGWRVFPTHGVDSYGACSCRDGADCKRRGKHPRVRAWQDNASVDVEQVRAWWEDWPDANVAVATGWESGIFVVDVDLKSGGAESYQAEQPRLFPGTLTSITGSGGWHLFYACHGPGVKNSTSKILQGVDVRGDGGYVILPPSRHESGALYAWVDQAAVEAEAPGELVDLVTRSWSGEGGGSGGSDGSGAGRGLGGWDGEVPNLEQVRDMGGIPEGERNDTLFRMACRERRRLGDDRAAVEVIVREAARLSGLGQDEVNVILGSAFAQDHSADLLGYGVADLTEAQRRWAAGAAGSLPAGGSGGPGGTEGGPGGLVGEGEGELALPLTDRGNGYRFSRAYGEVFRWVDAWGQWLMWDGRRWVRTAMLEHREAAARTADMVWSEVADVEDSETRKQLAAWARQSQMASRRESMLSYAQPLLAVAPESVDGDDWLVTVRNGTLDLRTGVLREHRPEDLSTLLVDTDYDPRAERGAWESFLDLVLPDPNVRWYVQKAAGYSLTGSTDGKAMFILYGSGNNGKSVFLEALRECVIGEYAGVAPKTLIMAERDEHATQLAGMMGKRFVTLSEEVEEKDRLRTSTLKSITGGDTMTARFMRQDFFEFKPKLKLWIATNHRPGLTDFGDAMRSRLRLVPFTVRIEEGRRRDREEVLGELRAERSGLLAWAVEGLAGWAKEGLEPPTAMVEAVGDWVDDEDVAGQWMRERLVKAGEEGTDGGSWTTNPDLHGDYSMWMAGRGEDRWAVTGRTLGKRMTAAGYVGGKRGGSRGFAVSVRGGVVQRAQWPAGGVS